MKRGSFTFDGVSSDTIKAVIQTRPLIEAPLRKVGWRSTYGVDGEMPFDEGAYGNTDLDLLLFTDGNDVIADRQTLYNLFDSRGTYKDFVPYFDPDKIYRVMLKDRMSFEARHHYGQRQSISAKFTVKPYKYLVKNDPITVTVTTDATTGAITVTPNTITNPTNYTSQPLIKVTGSGAVKLIINGIEFSILDVPTTIYVDSELYLAYQKDANGIMTSLNHNIATREYPVFKPGSNSISVSGSVTQLDIEPRWRSLV